MPCICNRILWNHFLIAFYNHREEHKVHHYLNLSLVYNVVICAKYFHLQVLSFLRNKKIFTWGKKLTVNNINMTRSKNEWAFLSVHISQAHLTSLRDTQSCFCPLTEHSNLHSQLTPPSLCKSHHKHYMAFSELYPISFMLMADKTPI